MRAGDILLVRNHQAGSSLISQLIMAGERADYGDSDYARWTHCALIVTDTGDLVEALAEGVKHTHASKYQPADTLVISPRASADLRAYACRFALAQVGTDYDYLDYLTLTLTALTGLKWSLHTDRRFICSELVARASECYTQAGYPLPCEQMKPANLGAHWNALSGDPLAPLPLIGRLLDKLRAITRGLL